MKIALCLLAHENSMGVLQNNYFPLSIGLINEFLKANIKNIDLNIELFKKPSELSTYIDNNDPDIVMFGNYMWIEKLNCFYAKSIKEKLPETLVVFGGPNLSLNEDQNISFLKENSYIDFLIDGDAEIVAKNLILAFNSVKKNIEETKKLYIPNTLSFSKTDRIFIKPQQEDFRLGIGDTKLDNIPSPYTSGAMDKFFGDGTVPLLESNRGCPYSCSFCQQGTKYFSKIRYYDHCRVGNELEYIAKKVKKENLKMNIVEFTDPNFGMYPNDEKISHHIRRCQDNYGFPDEVWCSSGKSQPERILANAKILKDKTIMIRATVQSMNKETLENIARKNLPVSVFKKMSEGGVETYSDVMLGLPSETKNTHIDGILELIDSGIDEFSMLQTIILKGTPMEKKEYIDKHGLKTKYRIIPECDGIYEVANKKERITETEKIIYQTKSLSFEDYLYCRKFNLLVMIFHNTRLLRAVYKFLDFYELPRSIMLRNIISLVFSNSGKYKLSEVLDRFSDETVSEISDIDYKFEDTYNIENIANNKIYKYLTLALTEYKNEILKLIRDASNEIIEKKNLDVLIKILDNLFLSETKVSSDKRFIKLSKEHKKIFKAENLSIEISDFQKKQITMLRQKYQSEEDILSKLAYHLRPINMIKQISFDFEKKLPPQSHQVDLYSN